MSDNSKVLVFLANGFEEIEGLTVVDLLRRANIEVDTVSIYKEDSIIVGARHIPVKADLLREEINLSDYTAVILPGGMPGTTYLGESETVRGVIKDFKASGKLVAAICAAPTVLAANGLLEGIEATCYPGLEDKLRDGGAIIRDDNDTIRVVRSGNVITSRGLGTAIDFALEIISYLTSEEKAREIRESVVYYG